MSLHIQLVPVGGKRMSVTQDTTLKKNVPYSVVENTYFPIKRDTWLSSRNTNRYRIIICKIGENNRQKLTAVLSIHASNRFNHIGVLSFRLLWLSLYGPRTIEGGRRFHAVCSGPNNLGSCGCYSCTEQLSGSGRYTKISYDFYKSHAVIVTRTVLCCTQTIWMLQSAAVICV